MQPMTVTFAAEAISLLINLLLLVWIVFLWNCIRVRLYRDALFELRQELFDRFLAAGCSFGGRAYREMRDVLNGSIHRAHQTRPLTVFLVAPHLRHVEVPDRASIATGEIERQIIADIEQKYRSVLVKHIFLYRLSGWLVAAWLWTWTRRHAAHCNGLQHSKPVKVFEAESEQMGAAMARFPGAIRDGDGCESLSLAAV
jgi:hypothetical protein